MSERFLDDKVRGVETKFDGLRYVKMVPYGVGERASRRNRYGRDSVEVIARLKASDGKRIKEGVIEFSLITAKPKYPYVTIEVRKHDSWWVTLPEPDFIEEMIEDIVSDTDYIVTRENLEPVGDAIQRRSELLEGDSS